MKKLGIICGSMPYSLKLADYLTGRVEQEYSVITYSSWEEMEPHVRVGGIDTVLTESVVLDALNEDSIHALKKNSEKIICLTEERNTNIEGYVCIYKYNPASVLISEITSFFQEKNRNNKEESTKIITVYSPSGGIGTTSFSVAIAEEKSKKLKVLYICLEPFSAISELLFLDDRLTIIEAIYKYVTEETGYDIQKYVQKVEGFDTIPPSRSYVELSSVSCSKWQNLFVYLREQSIYDMIVIELSEAVDSFMEMFRISDEIVILEKRGVINSRKQEQFIKELSQDLTKRIYDEKVVCIDVPEFAEQEDGYESMETTEIGRWISSIIGKI